MYIYIYIYIYVTREAINEIYNEGPTRTPGQDNGNIR